MKEEMAARIEEALSLRLIRESPCSIVVTDPEGTIQYVNPTFTEATGYTLEEAVGENPRLLKSGNVPAETYRKMWAALSSGNFWGGNLENKDRWGNLFWEHALLFPLKSENGEIQHYVAVKERLSDRQARENDMFASGIRIREMVRNIPLPLLLTTPEGVIRYLNPPLAAWLDGSSGGLVERPFTDFLSPETPESILDFYRKPWIADSTPRIEHTLPNPKGPEREVIAEGSWIVGTGDVSEKMILLTNVTEKRREQRMLQAVAKISQILLQREPFRELAREILSLIGKSVAAQEVRMVKKVSDHANDPQSLMVRHHWRNPSCAGGEPGTNSATPSPAFEVLSSRFLDPLRGGQALLVHKKDFPNQWGTFPGASGIESVLRLPIMVQGEFCGFIAIDHPMPFVWSETEISLLQSVANNLGLRIAQDRHLMELQDARRLAETAAEKAEAASRSKSSFLATMSHEIRTPLNGVLGTVELLQDSHLSNEQRDLLETIRGSGETLLHILNDILDYSKIEAGRIELEALPFDTHSAIRGAVSLFSSQAAAKGLDLRCTFHKEVPESLVGDVTRVRQILSNLVSNAIKFTHDGFVEIQVGGTPRAPDCFELVIEVRDTGIGIPEEGRARLFQVFSQLDSTTTRQFGGTGLGLSICKKLSEQMKGSLSYQSEVGKGTVFTFSAPFAVGQGSNARGPARNASGTSRANRSHQRDYGGKARILLVEDNAVNRKVASLMLKRLGHSCDEVTDGHQAIKACQRQNYDLVLMDCQMPGMDGHDATRGILALPKKKHPRIVALTAAALPEEIEKAKASGMESVLTKPLDLSSLVEVIQESIEPPSPA